MAECVDIRGIVDFLKQREDVASVFVFGIRRGLYDEGREVGVGVLMDEAKRGMVSDDSLDMGGWDLSDDFPHWPVSVVLLNSAPLFLRHHVARKGSVVFDRNAPQRLAFTERAINGYLDMLPDEHFHHDHEAVLELNAEELE
jgi:hypothetical protein